MKPTESILPSWLIGLLVTALLLDPAGAAAERIDLTSAAFGSGATISPKYSCEGEGKNPPLAIAGVPVTAVSLVLIVEDPDAPGGLFTHWMVWNMDAKTRSIAEGASPAGVVGRNDFGKESFGPPCPPSGTHRYYFRIFALDRKLDLAAGSSRRQLDAAMKGHVVAKGELVGRYSKQKKSG